MRFTAQSAAFATSGSRLERWLTTACRRTGSLWFPAAIKALRRRVLGGIQNLAFNQEGELQLAYGGTFHLELKTGARDEGFPLDLYAGYGMTLEGQPFLLLGVELPGLSGGYIREDRSGGFPQPVPRIGI